MGITISEIYNEMEEKENQMMMNSIDMIYADKINLYKKSKKIIDMHTHTNYSDGDLSPQDLIRLAIEKGISTLAITDHNTIEGIKHVNRNDFLIIDSGIKIVNGIELSAKLSNDAYRVYTLLGDGELAEGQVWEAAMFAGHKKLDNLVVIVDNNGLQIDGPITEVCNSYPIDEKFKAFNFHVINCNAHDFDELAAAFEEAKNTKGMPTAIIAKSVKGKGVSFMENSVKWHGVAPDDEQYAIAMTDLEKVGEALCQK